MMEPTASVRWSSRGLKPGAQFDAWRDVVDRTHLPWDLPSRREGTFEAAVVRRGLGAASLVSCVCQPCDGKRSSAQIATSSGEWFGVLVVLEGHEVIRQASREAVLGRGDFCVWDSRRPIEFGVSTRLRKLTLMLPQDLLRSAEPRVDERIACTIPGARGRGALFVSHVQALARECATLPADSATALLATTIELLGIALAPERAPHDPVPASHRQLLHRAQALVRDRLADPTLDVASLAAALRVSTRLLHRVFGEEGLGVERYLWQQRLDACRHALLRSPETAISLIAYRHGFSDAAHFSRAFRSRFGRSPRELRRLAREGPARPDGDSR